MFNGGQGGDHRIRRVFVEAAVAVFASILTGGINFLHRALVDSKAVEQMIEHPSLFKEYAAVQFDIVVIAGTLLVGTGLGASVTRKGKLLWPSWLVGIGAFLLLVWAVLTPAFQKFHPDLMTIMIPFMFSTFLLFLAIKGAAEAQNATGTETGKD